MNIDTNTKLELMKRVDEYVKAARLEQPEAQDTQLMMPELNKIAEEYSIDVTDLFVMYMDHIAITNRRIAQEAEEEMDFSKITRFY